MEAKQTPLIDLRAALAQQAEPTVTEDMKSAVRWAPSSAYWSERLREFFGPDAREGIDALERRLAKAQQAEPVQDQRCRAEPRSDGDFVCDCKIGECLGRNAALAKQVKTCAWRDNLDAIYETECGNLHIVNDGTLEENGMKYCCYCGKEIKDESPT